MKVFKLVLTTGAVSAVIILAGLSLGCNGSSQTVLAAQGGGAALSGPPTMNAQWKTRNPRKCSPVKHLPTPDEAAALSQCFSERVTSGYIGLLQNVTVQIGAPRPYIYNSDSFNADIDTTAKVYPIRGTADAYTCTGNSTCGVYHVTNGPGSCIKTTFGDWNCSFSRSNPDPGSTNKPLPMTY